MTKQMIEVDVPEGWKAVGYKVPKKGEYFYDIGDTEPIKASNNMSSGWLVVEKIQPREITIIETDEIRLANKGDYVQRVGIEGVGYWGHDEQSNIKFKIWKIKETK